MSTAKHTPGPWSWDESTDGRGDMFRMPRLVAATGEVCNFGDGTQYYPTEGDPPNEADARLIAAAPELLEACEAALETFSSSSIRFSHENVGRIQQLRDAIAKATGEAS